MRVRKSPKSPETPTGVLIGLKVRGFGIMDHKVMAVSWV